MNVDIINYEIFWQNVQMTWLFVARVNTLQRDYWYYWTYFIIAVGILWATVHSTMKYISRGEAIVLKIRKTSTKHPETWSLSGLNSFTEVKKKTVIWNYLWSPVLLFPAVPLSFSPEDVQPIIPRGWAITHQTGQWFDPRILQSACQRVLELWGTDNRKSHHSSI